ncbi:SpoIIE family protein phosphatase [Xylanimonas ulmi]|uniref:Sigma-B regulation protein RsbU (Phosphoserine phosphatase) n=1 Tax=Xylanimonas ulmi TaxID=228973 RepID=A0A4Q7M3T1_9MICO|nr:SpoIIE family protein phosphatase [Xylanibacterium ulmi]RZS62001.1 sigma-B regulation protein RsbU (phosphoserine phosphatase) [Xylanibacterium ulmi]
MRFGTRLLAVILIVATVAMGTIFAFSYSEMRALSRASQEINAEVSDVTLRRSQDKLTYQAKSYLSLLATAQATRYDVAITRVKDDIANITRYMEELYAQPDSFANALPTPGTDELDGLSLGVHIPSTVARTPQVDDELELVRNSFYLIRMLIQANPTIMSAYVGTASGIMFQLADSPREHAPDWDPRARPWFEIASATDGLAWTDVYPDAVTGEPHVTGAQAFRHPDGTIAGVVAADIPLAKVDVDLRALQIGETGRAFLVDAAGNVIVDTNLTAAQLQDQAAVRSRYADVLAVKGQSLRGRITAAIDGTAYHIAYAPMAATGWSLGFAVPVHEIETNARQLEAVVRDKADEAQTRIQEQLAAERRRFAVIFPSVLALVALLSIAVSRSITKPITTLAAGVAEVGSGNLDAKVDVRSNDEIGELATGFNQMTANLKQRASDLARVTAEKERINSDLRIATDIQDDMLPKIFPPYSDRDDLHLATFMLPAKEVGGDFYDFFFLDEEETKIALVIADVSGKSVPAALFMVIAKTLIKNNMHLPPAQVLSTVNNLLVADNNSSMFVTTYYSVLDLTTGEYCYASAGHNPPVLYRAASRKIAYLEVPKAPPLGVFAGKSFVTQSLRLEPGDALLLYTDGVTEAFNRTSQMYGSDRLLDDLSALVDQPAHAVVDSVYAAVETFADGEEQSDDITMLFCRYAGPATA